jgi:hypothetical protein
MIVIFKPLQGYPTVGQELTITGLGGPNQYSRLILSTAENSVKLWYQPKRLQTSYGMVAIKRVLRGRFDFNGDSSWPIDWCVFDDKNAGWRATSPRCIFADLTI